MDNLLRKVESDEVVVYTDQVYSIDVLNKCREIHQKLVDEGKIESDFDSDKWMGYSGVKKFGMEFSMDSICSVAMLSTVTVFMYIRLLREKRLVL